MEKFFVVMFHPPFFTRLSISPNSSIFELKIGYTTLNESLYKFFGVDMGANPCSAMFYHYPSPPVELDDLDVFVE